MNGKINILGFAGSLRKNLTTGPSFLPALEMVPDEATLEVFDLAGIPPFNQDIERNPPESVKRFKEKSAR